MAFVLAVGLLSPRPGPQENSAGCFLLMALKHLVLTPNTELQCVCVSCMFVIISPCPVVVKMTKSFRRWKENWVLQAEDISGNVLFIGHMNQPGLWSPLRAPSLGLLRAVWGPCRYGLYLWIAIAVVDFLAFLTVFRRPSLFEQPAWMLILSSHVNALPASSWTINLILLFSSQARKLFLSLLSLPACFLFS